jgi:hypothetical protein
MLKAMSTFRRHLVPFVTAAAAVLTLPATASACPASTKFVTPSGNIWCLVASSSDSTNGVVCEIREHSYSAPPKPADCRLDWGDRISLKPGGTPVVHCHGDTIFDSGMPTLPYGQTRWAGPIKCEAQPSGVICTDTGTGHFFRISRESLDLGQR